MKYVFVGDIHGKVHAVEAALARPGKKIFVGDFIDSYEYSTEDHKKCYDLVLAAIDVGEAQACFGNHELSYLLPEVHRCSGYTEERAMLMRHYADRIRAAFTPYIFINKTTLVSHAGLCNTIYRSFGLKEVDLPNTFANWWIDPSSPMHWIGYARGGRRDVGGLFWCDYNQEFSPIPGLTQIFGHTRGASAVQREVLGSHTSYCIDVLDKNLEFLELEIEES